jgi:hypothetical protein
LDFGFGLLSIENPKSKIQNHLSLGAAYASDYHKSRAQRLYDE